MGFSPAFLVPLGGPPGAFLVPSLLPFLVLAAEGAARSSDRQKPSCGLEDPSNGGLSSEGTGTCAGDDVDHEASTARARSDTASTAAPSDDFEEDHFASTEPRNSNDYDHAHHGPQPQQGNQNHDLRHTDHDAGTTSTYCTSVGGATSVGGGPPGKKSSSTGRGSSPDGTTSSESEFLPSNFQSGGSSSSASVVGAGGRGAASDFSSSSGAGANNNEEQSASSDGEDHHGADGGLHITIHLSPQILASFLLLSGLSIFGAFHFWKLLVREKCCCPICTSVYEMAPRSTVGSGGYGKIYLCRRKGGEGGGGRRKQLLEKFRVAIAQGRWGADKALQQDGPGAQKTGGAADDPLLAAKAILVNDSSWERVGRCQTEARALLALRHPHVLKYTDDFVHRDKLNSFTYYLITEFCVGGDLARQIELEHTNFSEKMLKAWFEQVGRSAVRCFFCGENSGVGGGEPLHQYNYISTSRFG